MRDDNGTLFERWVAPVLQHFLLDRDALQAHQDSIDWESALRHLTNPQVSYPRYYREFSCHGFVEGYLCPEAAVAYDAITQYALPPNEDWVRQGVIDAIQGYPTRILDLGCGTGSTTCRLKEAFPNTEVVGLDLSPYMLVMAEQKALEADLNIHWRQGKAEQTDFPDNSFDVVTASLLLHELPPAIAQAVLQEAHRLLRSGGEVIILDCNQKALRQTPFLANIFEEPLLRDYAAESLDAWLGSAQFGLVRTQDHWLVHQISRGVKGVHHPNPEEPLFADLEALEDLEWAVG
ncbi:class I SAM-dependent methyltransferase [Alkalinema pantanalense CENA528]|uniref:class I SAM-dependent methyltransferase n=1 Tax=Alkalinema pantanalense TaxID=1620705 RepID=UPI003D6F1F5A